MTMINARCKRLFRRETVPGCTQTARQAKKKCTDMSQASALALTVCFKHRNKKYMCPLETSKKQDVETI